MARYLLVLVALVLSSGSAYCQCSSLSSCSQCLSQPSCVWCSSIVSAGCLSRDTAHTCSNATVDPQSTMTITPLPLDENNQVSVSTVHMKLRVGQPQTFTVSVRAADNFPLDLYMLMDFSASFKNDLVTVKNIAPDIVSAVGNLTSRFQVGFGTFVDKVTAPYNSLTALRLGFTANGQPIGPPSACSGSPCSRPVSYEHVVNLTNSTDTLNQSVQDLVISTSSDDPEGTLDAMMQAVVCTDVVGWREEARKVLLVMTDTLMHTAGDGRLAGIYRPNDAKCHTQFDPTVNRTLYSDSLVYDYPTIEQMRMTLEQFGVVPVFAVSSAQDYFSDIIAPYLGGFADILSSDSDNIVEVIKEANRQIESRVSVSFNQLDYVSISIDPSCPNGSALVEGKSQCVNVSGQTVRFNVTVNLTSCTDRMMAGQPINIPGYIPGFGQFSLTVEGVCNCDCEQTTQVNSSMCSNNGNLTCGQCSCVEGWTGNDCSCSTARCVTGSNGLECSGRGSCVCGECVCHHPNTTYPGVMTPMISGNACQCDNFLCDKGLGGLVCSGQGSCECTNGQYSCLCFTSLITGRQHEGTACQCSYDNCVDPIDSCRDPRNMSCPLCSGRGVCDPCVATGSCQCTGDTPTTSYCTPIGSIEQASCDADESCVLCLAALGHEAHNYATRCPSPSCVGYIAVSTSLPDDYEVPGSMAGSTSRCTGIRDDQCTYVYYIAHGINGTTLRVVGPPSYLLLPPLAIVSIVVPCVIVVVGLMIIFATKLCIVQIDHKNEREAQQKRNQRSSRSKANPMYDPQSGTLY